MADVVRTKLFRNGGSVAVRIPAGWFHPEEDITLVRDQRTGRVYVTQGDACDPEDFFDFTRGAPYVRDPAPEELSRRGEPPRPSLWDAEDSP